MCNRVCCNMLQQRGVQHLARTRRRGACGASRQAAMHRPSATRLCTPGCGWVRRRAGTSDAGYLEAYGAGRGDHLVTFDDGRQVAWAPLCFFRRPFGGWVGSGSYARGCAEAPLSFICGAVFVCLFVCSFVCFWLVCVHCLLATLTETDRRRGCAAGQEWMHLSLHTVRLQSGPGPDRDRC